jgi:hypothetical protein
MQSRFERDQDAGLYVRAGRRDSRRVLRPADERVPKRVPRDQVVVDFRFSGRHRTNDCPSRVLARRGQDDGKILLRVRSGYPVSTGPGRPSCYIALAAQRGISR